MAEKMGNNRLIVWCSVSIFLLVCIIGITCAQEEKEKDKVENAGMLDCKKVMGRIMKKTLKTFNNCTKEVKASSTKEDFGNMMGCIIKCTMGKMELLTDEGIVTKASIQKYMDENIPEEAHELGHVLIEDCLEEHGLKLDKNEKFCESYAAFTQCMQNVIGDFADKAGCGSIGGIGR